MALSKTTKDHDEIRQWAESRGAVPAEVESTEKKGSPGILRFMFPKAPNHNDGALKEIEWDDFFEKFDANGLELIYQDVTKEGAESNFNKLIYPENESSSVKKSASKKGAATKGAASKSAVKTAGTSTKKSANKGASKPSGSKSATKTSAKKADPAKKIVPAKKAAPAKKATGTKKSVPATKSSGNKTAARKGAKKAAGKTVNLKGSAAKKSSRALWTGGM